MRAKLYICYLVPLPKPVMLIQLFSDICRGVVPGPPCTANSANTSVLWVVQTERVWQHIPAILVLVGGAECILKFHWPASLDCQNHELHVQRETLSQRVRWRFMEEYFQVLEHRLAPLGLTS